MQRLIGTTVYDFVGSRDPSEPAIAHHLAALAGGGQSFQYQRQDRWFEVLIEPLVDDAGTIVGCVGAAMDITTQRQTTQQLHRSLSLLDATLDATADGILVVDREGHVGAYNRRFLTLWRVPPSLVRTGDDRALLAFVSDQLDDPKAFLNAVQDLYASPDQDAFDVLRFKDGRVFDRYSMPQLVAGSVVGRVWSFRDVTEREGLLRRATFLADATRLLSSLDVKKALRSVAHLAVPYLGELCAVDVIHERSPERLVLAGGDGDSERAPELHAGALGGHSTIYTEGSRSHMAIPLRAGTRSSARSRSLPLWHGSTRRPISSCPRSSDAVSLSRSTMRACMKEREKPLPAATSSFRSPLMRSGDLSRRFTLPCKASSAGR